MNRYGYFRIYQVEESMKLSDTCGLHVLNVLEWRAEPLGEQLSICKANTRPTAAILF